MKVSKEFKTGLVVVLAIALLVMGVNFLKGNSFFGGDDTYYAYFSESGTLTASSAVTLNGVEVGKVVSVDLVNPNGYVDPGKRVLVKFNIQEADLKLAKGSDIEIVPGLLSVGVEIKQNFYAENGYFELGDTLQGTVSQDITEAITSELLPVKKKMEELMSSVENIVISINAFWDTSAAYSLDGSLNEVKIAVKRFGNVAYEAEMLITEEKQKLNKIFNNVASITDNLAKSNEAVTKIIGNAEKITDSLLTIEFTEVVGEATETLRRINLALEDASNGEGTLGKLLHDEKLYTDLTKTNEEVQNLVNDIKLHPERYIHVSVFGSKTKGNSFSEQEEKKIRSVIDTIPNK